MVRSTRGSLASAKELDEPLASGRSTRASSRSGRPSIASVPDIAAPAKPQRGRPSRSTQVAPSTDSISSVATPSNYSSASEYSTPLTSHVTTPAPSVQIDKINQSARSTRPRRSKIEVLIRSSSQAPTPKMDDDMDNMSEVAQEKAVRNSMYSLNPAAKRKRAVVDDSEDDVYSDDSPDAKLARQLQAQENRKGKISLTFDDSDDEAQHLDSSMDVAAKSSGPKGKGKANTIPSRRASTRISNAKKQPVSYDSDWDFQDESLTEHDPVKPVTKKGAKNILVKRKKPAPAAALVKAESSDDEPVPVKRGRGRPKRSTAPAASTATSLPTTPGLDLVTSDGDSSAGFSMPSALATTDDDDDDDDDSDDDTAAPSRSALRNVANSRRAFRAYASKRRQKRDRDRLEEHHPVLKTMWDDLTAMPVLKAGKAEQPVSISRQLKPFQLEGLAWMKAMEKTEWKGGLLGDEMGLGKTIQAVSLIMSDWPAKQPTLVLVPPVALMQWLSEIESYTDGTLKTLVVHGTNAKSKNLTIKDLKKYDVIIMSYNSLESMYRHQEKGFSRKDGIHKQTSTIHQIQFHRIILDEAHSIKTRTTMTAKACFALKVTYRWCLSGTPLQNRIGEFFSLIRFLNIRPFSCYLCKECPCNVMEWSMDENNKCKTCKHNGMRHVSVFNQELLNPIQKYGNQGPGAEAFKKLRLMTDRIMLRRLKKDHTNSMELPVKEIYVDRQFFGEEENDFANSIMTSGQRKFDTYVAQGVLLNNYANIFGLIMQMRQVADHPDLILKKNSEGGQNIIVCCICDEPAEEAIRSRCKHDFCRSCAKSYLHSQEQPDCPQCHIPLSIDLEQPEIEQDEVLVKKSSIINRIKMENWTSSSKIELLVHELHKLRSDNASHKSIIFSQFTTMLQLIEWRLRRAGITTVMLDGSMTPAQRAASIDHFMKKTEVECFLVSLKAGGVALNLTEASRVFIVDPWWNPAAEWQSADRCHRIGQTRPCTITRLCIEDSVESRMVLLQEKKTNMINSTINSDDAAMESLSPEDLQFLFRGT